MSPAQPRGFFAVEPVQQSVEESRCETIAAADTVVDVEFASGRRVGLAADPGDRAPTMPIRAVHFAQCSCHGLHPRILPGHVVDHSEERAGIELRFRRDFRPLDSKTHLEIFFVAYEDVDIVDDAADYG